MKILKKKNLKSLEVQATENGVTVWIEEEVNGKIKQHWLLDGSLIKLDGTMHLSTVELHNYNAIYDETDNTIKIIDKTKNQ